MKGKRCSTGDKIRILREADAGRSITELCREKNISEAPFHRWKREFGLMEVNEAKRLKELEKENTGLKKMLADSLLENRVLRFVNEKNMRPGHKKQMAQTVLAAGLCSGWSACPILRLSRATFWYQAGQRRDRQRYLVARMHALAAALPRYGYWRITALLRQEDWLVGKRQVQRLRRAEGLRVPPPQRKLVRRGHSTGLPTRATHRGHVWTWDFIADATVRGGALRMLTVLDEHTRECHVLRADRALRAADVLHWLQPAIAEHGAPAYPRSDNGPEFIAKEVQHWLAAHQIKTIYIEPGSPWQNGFVESFHDRFRDESLDREQLWTLTEARVVIEDFRRDYNQRRPHSRLGYLSPARFAAQQLPSPASVGLRPPSAGDRQTHIHPSTSDHHLD